MSTLRVRQAPNCLWLVAIVVLAALLRFVAIGQWPPGLYRDEAYNGLDALNVINGARPIFFEANNGREPLFIYLVAASVKLLGRTPTAVRVVSAVLGTLTVPAAYLLARAMYSRRVGLLAALVTGITVWTINLSRIGFRAVALPLFSALMLWQLWRGLQSRRWRRFALGGLFLGLSMYTYLAARFVPVALAVFLAVWGLRHKERFPWRNLALFALVALLVAAPLLVVLLGQWESYASRAGQVSILNPTINGGDPVGALVRNLGRTALMFVVRGDFIPRHNVPLRPVFDAPMGLAFLAGLAIAAYRRSDADVLLIVWTGVLLLPTILAEGAPHFLRAVGVLPVLLVFPAVALDGLLSLGRSRLLRAASTGAVVLILGASLTFTVRDYFLRHVRSEAAAYNFEDGAVRLAADVNRATGVGWAGTGLAQGQDLATGAQVLIAERLWRDYASLGFLVPESSHVTRVDPGLGGNTVESSHVRLVVWPYEPFGEALRRLPTGSAIRVERGPMVRGDLETEASLLCLTFDARPISEVPAPRIPVGATFGGQIQLVGADAAAAPQSVHLTLYWRALEAPDLNYVVFVHVEGEGMPLVAADSPPCLGYYTTDRWRAGDMVVDERDIALPRAFEPTRDTITVGLYRLDTMARLPVVVGSVVAGDSVTLTWPR